MKIIYKTVFLLLIISLISCNNDDPADNNRSSELIEVYIDGNLTAYSTNIIAKDFPLPASTGFTNTFRITSEDTSANPFNINFPMSNVAPFVLSVPASETLSPSISHFLTIFGVNFDDTNPLNSLVVNYTQFGTNTGDSITFDISGTYYEVGSSSIAHTLYVGVDIKRD